MRDDGDEDFAGFVKAVYGWALSDLPVQKPVDFLANLYQANLKCHILRKNQIPSVSYTMSALVEKVEIEDIQTATFPKGFEVFDLVTAFKFGIQTLKTIADELSGLEKLEELVIDGRYSFEILPEFLACKSIKSLQVSTWATAVIKFPKQLPEMFKLEELALLSHKIEGPLWECTQLKSLLLSSSSYEFSWEEVHVYWQHLNQLKQLEKLSIKLPVLSSNEQKIPAYIFKNENLKELHFLSKYQNQSKLEFPPELANMANLQELSVYTLSKQELQWVAGLPKLRRLNICSKSDFDKIYQRMNSYGSQADVVLV